MKNNLLQLALVSFAGLIVIVVALTLIGSGSLMNNNMMAGMNGQYMPQMNMNGMSGGYAHMPQNMPMGNGAAMTGMMNQYAPNYSGHMINNPYQPYGSMSNMNYNMGGQMNMPMNNQGMPSSPAPMIIVVPNQYSGGMNNMNSGMGMHQTQMMMGM